MEPLLRTALRDCGLPGVVCAASGPQDLYDTSALGNVDSGSDERMSLDTSFWIASISKLATAVAVLQLVERARIRLVDEVAAYLPYFNDLRVLTDAGLVPLQSRVTVHHLLTHTAGFGYEMWSRPLAEHVASSFLPEARSGLRRSLERPLLFQPGSLWNYGIGMDWAGLLVEHVSGRTLAEYLETHVFGPLHMSSTGFAPRPGASRAVLHSRQQDGSIARTPSEPNPSREFDSGGAGLYSTPRDVLRLLQAILRASEGSRTELLQPQTVAAARSNQIGPLDVQDLPSCAPERSMDMALYPGRKKKWSYFGMLHLEAQPGGRSARSVSWAGIANTFFWLDFDASLAGVVFAQSLPFLDPQVLTLADRYERALYATRKSGRARLTPSSA